MTKTFESWLNHAQGRTLCGLYTQTQDESFTEGGECTSDRGNPMRELCERTWAGEADYLSRFTLPDVGRIKKNYDNNNHHTRLRYCVGSIVLQFVISTVIGRATLAGFPPLLSNNQKQTNYANNFIPHSHLDEYRTCPCAILGELLGNFCPIVCSRRMRYRVDGKRLCRLCERTGTQKWVFQTTKNEITMWLIYGPAALWVLAIIVTIVQELIIKR